MRKRLLMTALYLLLGSFLIGLTLPQDRNIKIVAKTADGKLLPLYNASYALVIGVSAYTNGWPILPEAANDAHEVKAALEQHGFVVTLVKNPTAAQLEDAMKDFIAMCGLGAENRLLFYFAGHGYTQKKAYGADMGYIVPSDAPLPDKDQAGFLRKATGMENFNSYAREINAKHVLFLFDSCFSGSIFALAREVPAVITYKTSEPVRQFITAGSANETVPDKSIFKQQFLAALSGVGDNNNDGYVTGNELGEFLQTNVANYSRNTQRPQYGKIRDPRLDKGDFVFVVPFSSPPKLTFDPNQYEAEANRSSRLVIEYREMSNLVENKLHQNLALFKSKYAQYEIFIDLEIEAGNSSTRYKVADILGRLLEIYKIGSFGKNTYLGNAPGHPITLRCAPKNEGMYFNNHSSKYFVLG